MARIPIRKIGSSHCAIIPKPVLVQLGLKDQADMTIESNAIVLRKPVQRIREGWAEASKAIAASGDDALVWPPFANAADARLEW